MEFRMKYERIEKKKLKKSCENVEKEKSYYYTKKKLKKKKEKTTKK